MCRSRSAGIQTMGSRSAFSSLAKHHRITRVGLQAGGDDRLGELRMGVHDAVPQWARRIDEPPPGARRLHGDGRASGQPDECTSHGCPIVDESSLG